MANPPLESPTNPHFFQPLLPGFDTHLTIPIAFFSKYIVGKHEQTTVKLRSDASDKTWEVKMDGRRLTGGWKDFATSLDLRVGDIVIFKHEGDMVFNVTPFGPSFCEIQYTQSHIIKEEEDDTVDVEEDRNVLRKKNRKRKTEPGSCLYLDYCFVAQVTDSNLQHDTLYLPAKAARSSVLNRGFHEMIIVNKEGKSWTLTLKVREPDRTYYIRGGWRSFCHDNRQRVGDLIPFHLVGDGKSTPMICICPEEKCSELISEYISKMKTEKKEKRRCWVASSSSRQNRFVTIILTRYNIKNSKLILPITFVKINGIHKQEKIILMNKDGVKKRLVNLVQDGPRQGRRGLGKGWKIFCEDNHVYKIGVPFVLELIWEHKTPILKFCSIKTQPICV
ncbi:hypothetical protein AALP_AA7G280000 [Arabis alpina]|uniref:TF-B3 domain-containing protein n=1 Tax=Arabis alpina TaxID=50452 RepID=A0A087GL26_ARAAL|nr:hypothetical protein AALP_AA7G280000 [Arabis alpina]